MMKLLYEILVPTRYGDGKMSPIKTRHHKKWDERIQAISGGMTILSSARGKWTFQGVEYPEKVIPVRIMCTEAQMKKIVEITISHYRQKAVMYYVLSNQVFIVHAPEPPKPTGNPYDDDPWLAQRYRSDGSRI